MAGMVALYHRNHGSMIPEWWLSKSGQVAQIEPEYSKGMIDRKVYFRYPSKIYIGRKCSINRGCSFFASAHTDDKMNIVINDNVVIGPNVTIFSAGHDPNTINLADTYGRVTIESNVWIGGNTTILQGVTVHEGAVIGAGSIVTKDVPPWTINVGVPAKTIKNRKINKE